MSTTISAPETDASKTVEPAKPHTTPVENVPEESFLHKFVFGTLDVLEEFWNPKIKAYTPPDEPTNISATPFDRVQEILYSGTSVSSQIKDKEISYAPESGFKRIQYLVTHAGESQYSEAQYSIVVSSPKGGSFEVSLSSSQNKNGLRSAIFAPRELAVTIGAERLSHFEAEQVLEQLQARMDGDGQIRM